MRALTAAFLVLSFVVPSAPIRAQASCAHVLAGFEPPGVDAVIGCMQVFDTGSSRLLYLGNYTLSADITGTRTLVGFDGATFSIPGGGISGANTTVRAMTVLNTSSGPRLIVGGSFDHAGGAPANNVAAWDGVGWSALGSGLGIYVFALTVFDDGSGAKIYAGGSFTSPSNHVARFNGSTWESVGGGIAGQVGGFIVHDDGSGPALYAGYSYAPDGTSVAKWNGTNWVPLGVVTPAGVSKLASYDDGTGRKLYAGSSQGIRRWNGSGWENVGTLGGLIDDLEVIDLADGHGPRLYASGPFKVATWNGHAWTGVGTGALNEVRALGSFDTGGGKRLFAATSEFAAPGTIAVGVMQLDGSDWVPVHVGHGLVSDLGAYVRTIAQYDAGAGPEVYVGGHYLCGVPAAATNQIAKWDGTGWTGSNYITSVPTATVDAFASFDFGAGPQLLLGGLDVWRQSGQTWSVLGGPVATTALQVYDLGTGPQLAACGSFLTPSVPPPGDQPFAAVEVWNGNNFTGLGSAPAISTAYAMAVYDDGSGPALYCAGYFSSMNSTAGTQGIARWRNGWTSVGGGLTASGTIDALAVYDAGTGPALYAGGRFSSIGGQSIADIARWDGTSWSAVGSSGTNGPSQGVMSLAAHDDGSGSALFAGGDFTTIGGVSAQHIARWNGTSWSAIGSGADGNVNALASFDERSGYGRTLWMGGDFENVNGVASAHVARFGCTPDTGFPFCLGDAAHGATPCPCGNAGSTGHGCASAAVAAGALLSASGSTAPNGPGGTDSVVLACTSLPPTTTALFFQGDTRISATPFGDGARCTGGALTRIGAKVAAAGSVQYPAAGDQPISVRGQTPSGSGQTRFYQTWYRSVTTLCASAAFNISNGWQITW